MLTDEVAAIIRVLRTQRGIPYEELADIGVQRSISALEQAQVNISVNKLAELAVALDFDFVALVALCFSLKNSEPPHQVLELAAEHINKFVEFNGEKLLKDQFSHGKLVKRSRGKPANRDNAIKVRKLKLEGYTQADAARALGLSKSTVNRYWQHE